MRIPKMPLLFHFGPPRVELWPSKHLKSNRRWLFVLTRGQFFLLYFTTLLQPKCTLSVAHSAGCTTAAQGDILAALRQCKFWISLNTTWYKEPSPIVQSHLDQKKSIKSNLGQFLRKCNFNFLQCKKCANFCRFCTFPSLWVYFYDFWDWINVPKRWPDISTWL